MATKRFSGIKHAWGGKRSIPPIVLSCLAGLATGAVGTYWLALPRLTQPRGVAAEEEADHAEEHEHEGHEGHEEHGEAGHVELPKAQWATAGLRFVPAKRLPFTQSKWVTGKLDLNRDRTAHIYPLVEGRVHWMNVGFGDDVKRDQVLAIIDSRQVGDAKLALVQTRLEVDIAQVNHKWDQKINANTQELIDALDRGTPLTEVEDMFRGKSIGQYRQQLLTKYANLHKSRVDYERLAPLAEQGVAAGKQAIAAKAAYEADQAAFRATLEQLQFTVSQQALASEQALQKAQTQKRVAEARLFIMGYQQDDLQRMDPLTEDEEIAHYAVKAPFDGTIISKDAVIDERVGPDRRMFQLTDLSTLWVQADIYQQDLPRLAEIGKTLRFRSAAYDHEHEAAVFYAGDVVDPQTRTTRLMATVENADRHLKPGTFVEVQLPGETLSDVLQVPASAILQYEGEDFVFVYKGGEEFERRDVQSGAVGDETIQIITGLNEGDQVVVDGAFALKSKLLSGSVGGTHVH